MDQSKSENKDVENGHKIHAGQDKQSKAQISTMYTMRVSSGRSGARTILRLYPVFYLQGSSLKEQPCVFWVKELSVPLVPLP
ncbi:hypothetical protein LguiA_025409 [Lonicera macranthoides]